MKKNPEILQFITELDKKSNGVNMFIYDKPIESEKDDFLERKRFAKSFGKALINWNEKESLVTAIFGEWGSGKTSIINLAIEEIRKNDPKKQPTIIEFNPWAFTEEKSLSHLFFIEIAKELEIRKDTVSDEKIAKQFRFYSELINLVPQKKMINDIFFVLLSIFGIGIIEIIDILKLSATGIRIIIIIISILSLIIAILKEYIPKLADFFEKKSEYFSKSISEAKNEIKQELEIRNKKLLIVIDDIDRLQKSEIRQIFKLIKVNADFPNTIYLLAFDRNIVEKSLEEQSEISGKDYLNKIIQVNFNIPVISNEKIYQYLFDQLEFLLNGLPESALSYFDQDDPYWREVSNSGFKDLFKNIRDVKRFISSLSFNITQMYQGHTMEVNPIDFIALEAIRVFAPDFYSFMKGKTFFFTSPLTDEERNPNQQNTRKNEIEKKLTQLPEDISKNVENLISQLFPYIGYMFSKNYNYGADRVQIWSKNLSICSPQYFNSYFNLIPGGGENEITQFEIENILNKANSENSFREIVQEYINKQKFRKLLKKLEIFAPDENLLPRENRKNVIKVLFDISDNLPNEKTEFPDYGAYTYYMDLQRVVNKLFVSEIDKSKNFEIMKEVIPLTEGLSGPIRRVFLDSSESYGHEPNIPIENLNELKDLCVERIKSIPIDSILNNKNFSYILNKWKAWDPNETWKKFVDQIIENDEFLLIFINRIITSSNPEVYNEFFTKKDNKIYYDRLQDFIDLHDTKLKLENIKNQNTLLYEKYKKTIDFFLLYFPYNENTPEEQTNVK